MTYTDIINKLYKQKEILENKGYKVAYITLYGSQNYCLDIYNEDYKSDFDMKAVIVPTLDDLIRNSKPVSEVVDTEWGQCDVKDIRSYIEVLLKANPAYIETLFTEYLIIDNDFLEEFYEITDLGNDLVYALRAQMLRAMYGMMCEKEKAMCHPYPSIADKIEKYGYDGKQVHHIYRLLLMMKDYYIEGHNIYTSMCPDNKYKNFLIDLKMNKFSLEEAKNYVHAWMEEAKELRDKILSEIDESVIDYSIKEKFLMLSQEIIKKKIVNEIVTDTSIK